MEAGARIKVIRRGGGPGPSALLRLGRMPGLSLTADGSQADLLLLVTRSRGSAVLAGPPVIAITDGDGAMRAGLLRDGAADVVGWDCDVAELRARILLRLADHGRRAHIRAGPIAIDPATLAVSAGERPLPLPRREAALLAYLAARPGRSVAAEELRAVLWGQSFDPGTNSVAVHASRLRARLAEIAPQLSLRGERGAGYRLCVLP